MTDIKIQKYMFQLGTPGPAVEVNWPRRKRDEAHEARVARSSEVELFVLFDKLNKCAEPRLTPEERGAVAQAIRAQAARKRPRAERAGSAVERYLAAQIEMLLAIHECNKDEEYTRAIGKPLDSATDLERLIKRIRDTITTVNTFKDKSNADK